MDRPAEVTILLSAHARILRPRVYYDARLPRRPMVISRSDPVPNDILTGHIHPILLGAVRNGDRHDATLDKSSGRQTPQGGVIRMEAIRRVRILCIGATSSTTDVRSTQ